MDAVNGSKDAIGAEGTSVGDGALAGLNEIILPNKAGMIRVGMAQCKITCQKAAVWNRFHGG